MLIQTTENSSSEGLKTNTSARIADAEFSPEEIEQVTTILRAVSAR
jgi:hypothetical protein